MAWRITRGGTSQFRIQGKSIPYTTVSLQVQRASSLPPCPCMRPLSAQLPHLLRLLLLDLDSLSSPYSNTFLPCLKSCCRHPQAADHTSSLANTQTHATPTADMPCTRNVHITLQVGDLGPYLRPYLCFTATWHLYR